MIPQVQRLMIVTLTLILAASISCASQNNESVLESPYRGTLSNLIPQKVGTFELLGKQETNNLGSKGQDFGLIDSIVGIYTIRNKYLTLSVLRFSSTESAGAIIKKWKGGPCPAKESGPKSKKGVTLGERVIYNCTRADGTVYDSGIVWNNGSVVFIINAEPRPTELQQAGSDDFLEFEKNFTY